MFDKRDFVYDDKADQYRCPAGSIALAMITGRTLLRRLSDRT